jgi:hypothetical protein
MALSVDLQRLHDSLSCCTYNGGQHNHILIKETDVSAKLKNVTLIAPPGDWFSFDPDKGRGTPALMSNLLAAGVGHSHHRACDCVVIINRNGNLTVLYIDLKSGSPSKYSGQFKSTKQFVRYLIGLFKEFHGMDFKLELERYVILHGGKPALINKTTTVPKLENIRATSPEKPYMRELPQPARLFLKELLG